MNLGTHGPLNLQLEPTIHRNGIQMNMKIDLFNVNFLIFWPFLGKKKRESCNLQPQEVRCKQLINDYSDKMGCILYPIAQS